MRLQGHAARTDPVTAERVNGYVDTLDEIIKKIRSSIFGLQQTRQAPASLPARLMEIIDEHAPQLGFTVGISFVGPLDPGPGETVAHDILAVTREALSNCARHAHATAVSISLMLEDGLITLDVTDNGRGLGTPARSSGLSSMRRRAERNRGTCQFTTPASGGTRLTWTARTTANPGHGTVMGQAAASNRPDTIPNPQPGAGAGHVEAAGAVAVGDHAQARDPRRTPHHPSLSACGNRPPASSR